MAADRRAWTLPALAMIGLALAGCASSGGRLARHYPPGRPHYTIAPYQVDGVWYYPRVDYSYDRTGTASWYGPGYNHRPTSDGETYDMDKLSAAHKTLPLPSVVEVTNLQNGRELRLRVNDRGPFVGDRLIDVSRRAAQLLGFERAGTAPVRVRILKEPSIEVAEAAMRGELAPVGYAAAAPAARTELAQAAPPPPQPPPPQLHRVQLAAVAPQQRPTPSLRAAEIIAAPLPRPRAVAATTNPRPPPPPAPRAVATARHPAWPSLIASANAATLEPPRFFHFLAAPRSSGRNAAPGLTHRPGRIFVQAGAFAVPENARRVRARIAALGSAEIVPTRVHGAALYRVRLGPWASEAAARRALRRVVDRGYAGARLVDE